MKRCPSVTIRSCCTLVSILVLSSLVWAEDDDPWKVASVLGGDSLRVTRGDESQIVVLHGVRAPHIKSPDGIVAKEFLEELTRDQVLFIESVRDSEKLHYVDARLEGGTNLAEILLAYGLVEWDRFGAPSLVAYERLEQEAQKRKLGIWAEDVPDAEWEPAPYVLHSETDGSREALIEEDGTVVLRMKGNDVPDYSVRARASQEKWRRAEERAERLAEQERQRAEAIRQQQLAEAQAREQAQQDYLFHLKTQEQRLINEYWRQRLYGHHHGYPYPYPYPYNYTYKVEVKHKDGESTPDEGP